jgi:hypothetical protein
MSEDGGVSPRAASATHGRCGRGGRDGASAASARRAIATRRIARGRAPDTDDEQTTHLRRERDGRS